MTYEGLRGDYRQQLSPKTDVRVLVESNGVNNSSIAAGFDVEIWG